jgi:hypothetical protein
MLVIAVNHVSVAFRTYGLDGIDIPTPTSLGYSSSASIFVAMSGYMVGLIYSRKAQPSLAVLARARTLYVYNALLFVAVLPLLLVMDRAEAVAWDAATLYDTPAVGLAQFLLLIRAPALLDVLQLYVIFMLVTPAALWLLRRSPTALISLSLAIWAACQVAAAIGLFDPKIFEWNFNPAAWQLLFFAPMVFGAARGHEAVFEVLARRRIITALLAGAAAAFAVAKVLHLERAIPGFALLTSKGNLGALRLIHAPVIMFLYCGALALDPRIPHVAAMRALACVGRQTLPCYLGSAWITYLLAVVWDRYSGTYLTYLAAALAAVLVTLAVAAMTDARSKKRAVQGHVPLGKHQDLERTDFATDG